MLLDYLSSSMVVILDGIAPQALFHFLHPFLPRRLLPTYYSSILNPFFVKPHPLLQPLSMIFFSCSLRGKMHFFSPYVSMFFLVHYWVAFFTPMVLSINFDEFALIALTAHIIYDSHDILAINWSTRTSLTIAAPSWPA